MKTVVLAGGFAEGSLERSYSAAFRRAGVEVVHWNASEALDRQIPYGRVGRKLARLLKVHVWARTASRSLITLVQENRPDALVVFGAHAATLGALAQIRTSCPDVRLACIWPDTLLHLDVEGFAALRVFDIVFSYSRDAIGVLNRLGVRNCVWLPLAADRDWIENMRPAGDAPDVVFIGNWRPEREAILDHILLSLPGVRVGVWGFFWDRHAESARVRSACRGHGVYGKAYSELSRDAGVCLNVIDPTNYPAANMRFFEIAGAGAVQLSTPCPELDAEYVDGDSIAYAATPQEFVDRVRVLLADEGARAGMRTKAREITLARHTYDHRVRELIGRLAPYRSLDSVVSST